MTIQESLKGYFGKYAGLEQVENDTFRLYAPFFHEDGDMYSIYLKTEGDFVTLRDFGNTLMRVSYTFDLNTPNKRSTLEKIVTSNMGELEDGELVMRTTINHLPETVIQYSQMVSKVSNIDILSRETVKTMFYDYLSDFMAGPLEKYHAKKAFCPTEDKELIVDYAIEAKQPLYLFGVKDDTKAAKVVISCLNFQKRHLPFRSVIVHENFDSLTKFNRNQITNVVDKQFTSLEDFKAEGESFLDRSTQYA